MKVDKKRKKKLAKASLNPKPISKLKEREAAILKRAKQKALAERRLTHEIAHNHVV